MNPFAEAYEYVKVQIQTSSAVYKFSCSFDNITTVSECEKYQRVRATSYIRVQCWSTKIFKIGLTGLNVHFSEIQKLFAKIIAMHRVRNYTACRKTFQVKVVGLTEVYISFYAAMKFIMTSRVDFNPGNACYYSVQNLLSYCLTSKRN
jgi:hypothetical protein